MSQRTHNSSSDDLVNIEKDGHETFAKLQQQANQQRSQIQHEVGTRRARGILIIVPLALFVWALADDYLQQDDEGVDMDIRLYPLSNSSSAPRLDASGLLAGLEFEAQARNPKRKKPGKRVMVTKSDGELREEKKRAEALISSLRRRQEHSGRAGEDDVVGIAGLVSGGSRRIRAASATTNPTPATSTPASNVGGGGTLPRNSRRFGRFGNQRTISPGQARRERRIQRGS